MNPKTVQTLTIYCKEGKIPAEEIHGVWHIEERFAEGAEAWRRTVKTRQEMIDEAMDISGLKDELKSKCRRFVVDNSKELQTTENPYAPLFVGTFLASGEEERLAAVIKDGIERYSGRSGMMPVSEICEKLGLSRYVITTALRSGDIPGIQVSGAWYASPEDVRAFGEKSKGYIGIQDTAARLSADMKTLFDPENPKDRALLNGFLRQNEINDVLVPAGILNIHGDKRNTLFYPEALKERVESIIAAYLRNWGLSEERLDLLMNDPFWERFPKTFRLLKSFSEGKNTPAVAALMEILIHSMEKEIMDCSDEEIFELSDVAAESLMSTHRKIFAKFMRYVQEKTECSFEADFLYDADSANKLSLNTSPYPFAQYVMCAALVFNDDSIRQHDLVNRAIEDPDIAYTWFYMIMHFLAAWRTSDINNIRVIGLLHDADTVKRMMRAGIYTDDAVKLSLLLEYEINGQHILPEKTHERQNKHFLVIRIPESVRAVVGIAYSLVILHSKDDKIQTCRLDLAQYKRVFGDSYTKIFGNEAFGNRRANKSFMNAVRDIINTDMCSDRHVMGDVVVAYARAHSSPKGLLAEATNHYLQTTMDGYDANTIMKLLFESGACSFVPYMLLESVYGDQFAKLSFPDQNEIVTLFGHDAYESDFSVTMLQKSYLAGKQVVDELLRGFPPEGIRSVGKEMLEKIICREAQTKQLGISCLLSTRNLPCAAKTAKDCAGCRYKVLHRGAICYILKKIRLAYERLRNAKTAGEKAKIRGLLEQRYIPAAIELLRFTKIVYHEDISAYKSELALMMKEMGRIQ